MVKLTLGNSAQVSVAADSAALTVAGFTPGRTIFNLSALAPVPGFFKVMSMSYTHSSVPAVPAAGRFTNEGIVSLVLTLPSAADV